MSKIISRDLTGIRSFNPVVGCNIGCSYCYARRSNKRYKIIPKFSEITYMDYRLHQLYGRTGNVYFCNSMSDLSGWKPEWRKEIFKAFSENPQHIYLLLTKRPGRLWYSIEQENIWMGCTVTTTQDIERIQCMTWNVPCRHYWVCFEPVFEDLGDMDLSKIDWVVIGRETGPQKDKIIPEKSWIMKIVEQAKKERIPVSMKESLKDIVGKEDFLNELPSEFLKVLDP